MTLNLCIKVPIMGLNDDIAVFQATTFPVAVGPVNSPEYQGYVQIQLHSSYIVLRKTGMFATLTEIEYVKMHY